MLRFTALLVLTCVGVLCQTSRLSAQTAIEALVATEDGSSANSKTTVKKPVKIPATILNAIKSQAAKSHPDDFSTQLYVIKTQSDAYQKLIALQCPNDIPETVFKTIVADASRSHSNDYSTRLYVINSQTNAYRELVAFDWPTDVPKNVLRSIAAKAYESHATDYSTQLYVIRTQIKAYYRLSDVTK